MNKTLAKNIYDRTISSVLKGMEGEYISEVSRNYQDFLLEIYSELEVPEEFLGQAIDTFSASEAEKWGSMPKEAKESFFINDEKFKEIGAISQKAFDCAQTRLLKGEIVLSGEEAEGLIRQLEETLPFVKPFNSELAKSYVSEGILDLMYASGKTESTSFRIGKTGMQF